MEYGLGKRLLRHLLHSSSTPSVIQAVSSGVEVVFSSPAAISAAFGFTDGVGINVKLLDDVQQSILDLYACE